MTLHWDSESSWNRKQSKQQYLALDRNFPRSSGAIASFLLNFQVILSGLLCMAPEANMLYNVSKLNIPSWIIYITPSLSVLALKMKGDSPETVLPSVQTDFVRSQHFPSQGTMTDLHYFLLKPVWFAMKKKPSWSVLLPQLTTRWKSFSTRCLLIRKSTNEKKKNTASFQENVLEEEKEDSHPISNFFWRLHWF